jgi:hypothetical protein
MVSTGPPPGMVSLFAECPLPGCRNPVDDPRWPCRGCETALAGYMRPTSESANPEEVTATLARSCRSSP